MYNTNLTNQDEYQFKQEKEGLIKEIELIKDKIRFVDYFIYF